MLDTDLPIFLREQPSLAAYLGSGDHVRVFPLAIPQKAGDRKQVPAIVYTVTDGNRQKTYCGTSKLIEAIVNLDYYDLKMTNARRLANAARAALLDYRGAMGDTVVRDVTMISSLTLLDMDPGLFRVADTYSIWYEEE